MFRTVIPDRIYLSPPVTSDRVVDALKEAGISWVCNSADFDNGSLLTGGGFHFLLSGFIDNGRDQEWQVWENLRTFILEWLDSGEKLAIHCTGGPRRSVSVAYLVLRLMDLTDDQAILYLKAVLPDLLPLYSGPINDWLGRRDQKATVLGGSQVVI